MDNRGESDNTGEEVSVFHEWNGKRNQFRDGLGRFDGFSGVRVE